MSPVSPMVECTRCGRTVLFNDIYTYQKKCRKCGKIAKRDM